MATSDAEQVLRVAGRTGALLFGDFTLSAGGTSRYYFDGRLVTLDPEGAYYVGRAMLAIARRAGAEAIAGPTLGADPIVAAVALLSHLDGPGMAGLIVRKEAKEYGGGRQVEGPLRRGARVAVADDTCTGGGSLLRAIAAVEQEGCQVVTVACILDRREGGSDEIRRRGYRFEALLEADGKGGVRVCAG